MTLYNSESNILSQITDNVSSVVIAQLLFLQSESSKNPIHMYINSPGGSVTAGLGIYDTMQYVLPPVATWCVGQACSMASLLLASGAKGMRHSLPNARIMTHQPSGGVQGQATDIQIQALEILKLKKQINELYVKHTGQLLEKIGIYSQMNSVATFLVAYNFTRCTLAETSMERDNFMSPIEAKEFGLIDKVLAHPMQEETAETEREKTGNKQTQL